MRHSAAILLLAALPGCAISQNPPASVIPSSSPNPSATDAYAEQSHRREVQSRVWQKDWQRWYDLFRSDGYDADEAGYKATQYTSGNY